MKETFHKVTSNAEDTVESVMGKIGDTFNFHSSKDTVLEDLEEKTDGIINSASDSAAEVISEAETVLASEAESVKETFSTNKSAVFERMHSVEDKVEDILSKGKENLTEMVNNLDESTETGMDMTSDSVETVVENLAEDLKTSPEISPTKEIKQEE